MKTIQPVTILGIFPTRAQAESAIDHLWHAGFTKEQVGSVMPGGEIREATTATEPVEERAANGAVGGAIAGGALGAVAGAAVATLIPGAGPVLAGGLLAAIGTGAAAGAAVGAYAGPFIALGFSKEEAETYGRHVETGSTVVAVRAEGREDEAFLILKSHGGRAERRETGGGRPA
jgi:hypothetical protein